MVQTHYSVSGEPVSIENLTGNNPLSLDPETLIEVTYATGKIASILAKDIDSRYVNLIARTREIGNSQFTAYPERGGIITSLVLDGVEVFYQGMLDETLHNPKKSVKGGMPFLFPNAGPLTQEEKEASGYTLAQHGFARNSEWKAGDTTEENQFVQSLDSADVGEMSGYPFDGSIKNTVTLENTSATFEYEVENRSQENLPISLGLHPYFDIPNGDKSAVEWRFEGGEQIKDEIENWSNDGTTCIDVPADGKIIFFIPGVGEITIEVSPDLKRLWVWSLSCKNFVCVEPVQNDEGGIVKSPVSVGGGETFTSWMKIHLKK